MKKPILLSLVLILLITACSPEAEADAPAEGLSVEDVYTAVAQTIEAKSAQATSTPSVIPTSPATITPVPTIATFSTPTPQQKSYVSNSTAYGCYDAAYVSDVTIPDGTVLTPGETFTKTWQFLNSGSCAWDEDFILVFSSGEDMDGADTEIGTSVAVGSTGSLSVEMVAPDTAGSYTGYWRLTTADGINFGQAVYVMITVSGSTATPTQTFTPTETYTPTPIPTETPVPTETTDSTNPSDTSG